MCCELSLPLDLFPTLASWYHVIGLKLEAAPERVYVAFCVIMTELSHLSARLLTHIQISSEMNPETTFLKRIMFPHLTIVKRGKLKLIQMNYF